MFSFLVAALAISVVNCASEGEPRPVPGGVAPDFELQNLDGQTVSLRDFQGSPVLLNFWASWCGPCRFEMPFLQEISEEVKWKALDLEVIAVNLGESAAEARGFMEGSGFTFKVLLDRTGKVGDVYNIRSIPTTFFIDERGIIRDSDVGAYQSTGAIEQRLEQMIYGDG